jgi:putative methylase
VEYQNWVNKHFCAKKVIKVYTIFIPMPTKSQLAIMLSKLKQFDSPKVVLEQYSTDPEIAAEVLWFAHMQGDISNRFIADLGCGPGVFGIGAAALGAKKVFFVDKDPGAINVAKENIMGSIALMQGVDLELVTKDVADFALPVHTVLQNPPFGTKIAHHDRLFLGKAFEIADVVYSMHKITSKRFIEEFAKDSGFKVTHVLPFEMRLVRTMKHHRKPAVKVEVGVWRMVKSLA